MKISITFFKSPFINLSLILFIYIYIKKNTRNWLRNYKPFGVPKQDFGHKMVSSVIVGSHWHWSMHNFWKDLVECHFFIFLQSWTTTLKCAKKTAFSCRFSGSELRFFRGNPSKTRLNYRIECFFQNKYGLAALKARVKYVLCVFKWAKPL